MRQLGDREAVHADHAEDLLARHAVEASNHAEPGVVDEDADRQVGDALLDALDRTVALEVLADDAGRNAVPPELGGELLEPIDPPRHEGDADALRRESARERHPDAADAPVTSAHSPYALSAAMSAPLVPPAAAVHRGLFPLRQG
jgi:hypothetical protein